MTWIVSHKEITKRGYKRAEKEFDNWQEARAYQQELWSNHKNAEVYEK